MQATPLYPPERRPAWLIAVHWLTVVALFTALGLILLREDAEGKALRGLLLSWHRWLGLGVGLLTLLRLLLKLSRPTLPELASGPPLALLAARAVHLLLYAGLIALPLLGWALSSARGHAITLFSFNLPALCAVDPDRADLLEDAHRWTAWSLMALVAAHAAAAMWHHFITRDEVLRAMLPWSPRRLARRS